jgi:hypothetical protein
MKLYWILESIDIVDTKDRISHFVLYPNMSLKKEIQAAAVNAHDNTITALKSFLLASIITIVKDRKNQLSVISDVLS